MANKNQINPNTVLIISGGIVAILVGMPIIKSILENLDLIDTKSEKDFDEQINDPGSFWSPVFWQKCGAGTKLLKIADCENLYNEIYDSFGIFDDDETRIYAAFKNNIKYQSQLSFFSWYMSKYKNKDILDWLIGSKYGPFGDHLSTGEISVITDYVKKLPKCK